MAYATDDDVAARAGGAAAFVRLFDRDGDGVADAEVLAAARAYAEALVDAHLRPAHGAARFDDPGPPPALVTDLTARLMLGYAGESTLAGAVYKEMKASALADLARLGQHQLPELPAGTPGHDAVAAVDAPDLFFTPMGRGPARGRFWG